MTELSEIFSSIEAAGVHKMYNWQAECERRIMEFAKIVQPSSPFKDIPKYNRRTYLSKFWVRKNTKKHEINMYGIAPNVSRIKGFNAPVNKWHNTNNYVAPIKKRGIWERRFKKLPLTKEHPNYHVKPFRGRWIYYYIFRSMRKAQTTAESLAFPIKTPHFFGREIEENIKYFGLNQGGVFGFGRFSGGAVPLYYYQSFADYLDENYKAEIDRIIVECGQDVLNGIV